MSYYFSKILRVPFEEAIHRTAKALKQEGFGIITEIDVRDTLKKKLDINFRPYRILGACNPRMAYEALQLEDKIGTMLPCNVVVHELAAGRVEIAAIDPVVSMQAVENSDLLEIATAVRDKLKRVIDTV